MNLDCNENVISHVCQTSSYSLSFRLSVGRHQGQTIGLLALLCERLCGFSQSLLYIMYWNKCLNQVMTISCLLVQKAGKQTPIFQPWICDWTQNIHCYLPSWDLSLFILEVFILTGTVLFFMTGCKLNSGTVYLQTLLQLFIPNMEPVTIYVLFNILHTRLIIFCQSVAQFRKFTRLFHIGQCQFTNNTLLLF
jgi:hypothetical protein